jgi:hypothetical protein
MLIGMVIVNSFETDSPLLIGEVVSIGATTSRGFQSPAIYSSEALEKSLRSLVFLAIDSPTSGNHSVGLPSCHRAGLAFSRNWLKLREYCHFGHCLAML